MISSLGMLSMPTTITPSPRPQPDRGQAGPTGPRSALRYQRAATYPHGMGTPLGDFIRTKRDSIQPETLGLPDRGRRRSPGLHRSDLATRAGISVEYLTRIEQGRDRDPSVAVVNALADALSLDPAERNHLRYLAKITGGACSARTQPAPPRRDVRPSVLRLLEPGIAVVTNRLGDVLAHTSGYEAVTRGTGLLDADTPNLTRYVFTDPRARTLFADCASTVKRPSRQLRNRYKIDSSSIRRSSTTDQHTRSPGQDVASCFRAPHALTCSEAVLGMCSS
jgi:transcriptional regulator with XRE-family HTH domain